jgi:hypothetical protein
MGENNTKLSQNLNKTYLMSVNIPNSHNIFQNVSFQGPPIFTQIGIFGMKRYPLATLAYPLKSVERRQ